ncbi:MAG: rRNA pseudouridine synthase [Deltaproteobacteria bacterium]|nr:rRNA pseudouridine synthase [Deltaproteobacteria bacterium]
MRSLWYKHAPMDLVRLQKVIADRGLCSRRQAEYLISEGKIKVNGLLVTELGTKVNPQDDRIEFLGKEVRAASSLVYYLFYKPKNVMSTLSDPQGRPCIQDYLHKNPTRVFPIGRLDFQSEGLMILTNDGNIAQRINHPSGRVQKVYHVEVQEVVTPEVLSCLKEGAVVEGDRVKPLSVRVLKESWLEFVLGEGRKREIRVICGAASLTVQKLIRVAIGSIEVSDLKPGQLKEISSSLVQKAFRSNLLT